MPMSKVTSKTDWERLRRDIELDAPIVFDPEDEFYDPNDDEAVEEFFRTATVTVTRRRPSGVSTKRVVSLHLSPEVVEHYQSQGEDWQARMDEVLRKGMA